ncbi:MAG: hypothetical protein Q7T01_02970 [bacterium]|nr:hypothetical protein [bacterium]
MEQETCGSCDCGKAAETGVCCGAGCGAACGTGHDDAKDCACDAHGTTEASKSDAAA